MATNSVPDSRRYHALVVVEPAAQFKNFVGTPDDRDGLWSAEVSLHFLSRDADAAPLGARRFVATSGLAPDAETADADAWTAAHAATAALRFVGFEATATRRDRFAAEQDFLARYHREAAQAAAALKDARAALRAAKTEARAYAG